MESTNLFLQRHIREKARYYSNQIFVLQNSQDLEKLLNTKYADKAIYRLMPSNNPKRTVYYNVEFINLANGDVYKNVVVRLADCPQDYDEFMPIGKSQKPVFSIARDELTIEELEEQFDRILNNDKIISIMAKKTLIGEKVDEDDYTPLYRFDVDVKARAGYAIGSSDKGVSSAVRNAFTENKYKFPALSAEEREEVKEGFLEILREEAEKLKNEEGRGRRKREIMVFYQEN